MPAEASPQPMGNRRPVFKHRVAAVIRHEGHVLVHRGERDAFWALPGGTIERGETSRRTLARELVEELGIAAEPGRLLWLAESFFVYVGQPYQEYGFYFEVDSRPFAHLYGRQAAEGDFFMREAGMIFRWQRIDALGAIDLRPAFLREGLACPPATVRHVEDAPPG
jgi:8-oxo-dGTP pyrophosphatase MutT (NUDIX family)